MEFSLLNLKDFGTLFPNNNITAVAYKEAVNKYINDKLVAVKNINGLSGNELIKKKKDYINTYILPLMNLLFSKYYIQYNNLNILVNKNNSILHEFNNLKIFYAYNNPIINNVNVYFYKKYSGLNKNNGNKENKSLIDINTLTILQNNKTDIVTNLTDYINNLTFENKKITYKKTLEKTIASLTDEMNNAIIKLNGEAEYTSITNNSQKFIELNQLKNIDDINNFIKGILNKVIYYHKITQNESKLISDVNNILKYACSILIKTKIASSITININIPEIPSIITSLTRIKDIYEKQIKLYKNYISSNKSNNNIKKITYENLINLTETYYGLIKGDNIINKPPNADQQPSTINNTQNNLFINQLCTFIYYDNVLTNKFIRNNNTDDHPIIKLDDILPELKKYKETLKLNLNSKNTKNTIINNDTLKKFFKNEKDLFQNFLTEIGASTASEKNKTNYDALKIQNNIFDKINKDLIEINEDLKKIENFTNILIPNNYNDAKVKIDKLNNIIKEVNSNKKKALINTSDIAMININNIYKKRSPQDVDYTKNGKILDSSIQNINNSISSLKEAINDKKSTNQSKFIKYANYWINTYSKIIIKEFPDNYENSSYTEIIPVFDRQIKINIKKCVSNLYDSFIAIDKKLIEDINESTKKIQKNRLMFYLTQDDKFQKINDKIKSSANINLFNNLISSYISSFKNKNAKQDLFINQIKKDNKSTANNPDIQQFFSTIYTYNDTLIANLESKINNLLITKGQFKINNKQLNMQIIKFQSQINSLFTKITNQSSKNNKTSTLNNKNKNLIYIPAYTDVIQLYFMNLIFIKLLYTNS
jgi:hypothetical protein